MIARFRAPRAVEPSIARKISRSWSGRMRGFLLVPSSLLPFQQPYDLAHLLTGRRRKAGIAVQLADRRTAGARWWIPLAARLTAVQGVHRDRFIRRRQRRTDRVRAPGRKLLPIALVIAAGFGRMGFALPQIDVTLFERSKSMVLARQRLRIFDQRDLFRTFGCCCWYRHGFLDPARSRKHASRIMFDQPCANDILPEAVFGNRRTTKTHSCLWELNPSQD